jgi:hypothetical protein
MRLVTLAAVAATLAACSPEDRGPARQDQSTSTTSEVAAGEAVSTPATGGRSGSASDALTELPVGLPKLSYSYALSYLVPDDRIATAQDAHRNLCEEMGPARCQLLELERGIGEKQANNAKLRLRVATGDARRFQVLLDHEVTEAGGRIDNARIGTDEVSKQIVDTEARIRQRELLVSRLTDVLRTRKGKASELVEAERSVTQAQEELDQARSWLADLRGRVAMSEFEIRYAAIAPTASSRDLGAQLGEAAQGSGAVFLIGLRFLLSLIIYLLPWALLAALPLLLLRAWRKRSAAVTPQG